MEQDSALVDLIYEAALVPELWPRVLDNAATRLGSIGGLLFTGCGSQWTCSAPVHEPFRRIVEDGWLTRNSRLSRSLAAGLAHRVVTDFDIFSEEEMELDPLCRALRSIGWGWFAGMAVRLPKGDMAVFSFERAASAGPYDLEGSRSLEQLRSPLARATLLSARFGLERCRAITETLDGVGLPAAVLGRGGRVLAANRLLEALMPTVVVTGRMRLHLTDALADARLETALRALDLGQTDTVPLSLPLRVRKDAPARVLQILPLRGSARDLLTGGICLVLITSADRRALPSAALIGSLFELSPREAALALAIGSGDTLAAYARRDRISAHTAKSQLKRVFDKTGTRRQADLVGLMTRLGGL